MFTYVGGRGISGSGPSVEFNSQKMGAEFQWYYANNIVLDSGLYLAEFRVDFVGGRKEASG